LPRTASISAMRSLPRILAVVALPSLWLLLPTAAWAQLEGPPVPDKGFCAPWHRCLAFGGLGIAVLAILALGVGFLIQRRGFDKIEHRQGNPDGVDVEHR